MAPLEPAIPRLTIQEVKQRMDQAGAAFVIDVRRAPDHTQIRGAVYYDPDALLTADHLMLPIPKERTIVAYCADPDEATSTRVARKLVEHGYTHVHVLAGGYANWKRRKVGYPIERRSAQPLEV